jgi:dynein heavy chain 2
MTRITEALAIAADRRREVEVLARELQVAEEASRGRKAAVENELAEVTPILDQAKAAVGSIKRENMDEIRMLKMPPEAIADVLSVVLLMLGEKDGSWQSMKKFLSNRSVITDILNFDARRMDAGMRKEVAKMMAAKANSFEHAVIFRASVAAAPLAAWVKANIKYSSVLESIAPLERELAAAGAALERSQAALDGNRADLQEIDDRVQALKVELGARTAEAESLKLALGAHGGHAAGGRPACWASWRARRSRWGDAVADLQLALATLPLQAMVAAGFCDLPGQVVRGRARQAACAEWLAVLKTSRLAEPRADAPKLRRAPSFSADRFDLLRTLSSESEMLAWKTAGLPSDTLSCQNAVVILNAHYGGRCPFVIDPAMSATDWLQRTLEADKSSPLEVVLASDPRFANQVELAVRFGKTLLVREAERVEPMLVPLIRRDLAHQGPRLVVSIGDKAVDFNEQVPAVPGHPVALARHPARHGQPGDRGQLHSHAVGAGGPAAGSHPAARAAGAGANESRRCCAARRSWRCSWRSWRRTCCRRWPAARATSWRTRRCCSR